MAGQASTAEPPNVLLICVDDLRPELRCFGADYIQSPNIDRLAERGRAFHRHYVQAPTCGASRFAMLTGRYGGQNNGALFERAEKMAIDPDSISVDMPTWFRQHGYTTVSVGKISHHPGGRGGPDWDDDQIVEMPGAWDRHLLPAGAWKNPRGWMHGLANGEVRSDPPGGRSANPMAVFQSVEGDDSIYPDGGSIDEALRQLAELTEDQNEAPFFLAVGILRPHLPFGAPGRYMEPYRNLDLPAIEHPDKPAGRTTWHNSGELRRYNLWGHDPNTDSEFADEVRRHYAACVSYADAQVGRMIRALENSASAENTIVVLWGDHGWHLGEHAVWGKHTLFEESLLAPLIVVHPDMPAPGRSTSAMVESIDLFPTLCELTKLPVPESAQGRSLQPVLKDPFAAGHEAISYQSKRRTIRTNRHRLILHDDGFVELYDHDVDGETNNIAEQQEALVAKLVEKLDERLVK